MKSFLATTATAVIALAGAAMPAAAQERVTVGLPGAAWSVQFAYYTYGEQLGFFREEGIDALEYVSVSGSAVLLPQVANNQVQFGYANPDLAVIAASRGEPLPVTFVVNWLRSQTFEFVTLEDSPVTELADLAGGKLGVGALTWGNLPMSRAMLSSVGLRWNEDVEILPIGLGAAAWRRLETGEVDAVNLFVGEHGRMEMAGIPIRRIPMPDQYRTIFSNGIVTNDTMIAEKPEIVEGFGRALVKSWIACKANTEACVRAFWETNPAAAPAAGDEAAQLERDMQQVMFDINQIDDFTVGGPDLYGYYPEDAWERLIEVMANDGEIDNTDFDRGLLFTNRFAEAFNDFDAEAVAAAAE